MAKLVVGSSQAVRVESVASVDALFTMIKVSIVRDPLQYGASIASRLTVRDVLYEEIHWTVRIRP